MLPKRSHAARIAFAAAILMLALTLVSTAVAGKGGTKNNAAPVATGTLSPPVLVVDQNEDGLPNAGDSVTFNVSSTAAFPYVQLTCSRNGSQISQQTLGFFGSWSSTYYLGGLVW